MGSAPAHAPAATAAALLLLAALCGAASPVLAQASPDDEARAIAEAIVAYLDDYADLPDGDALDELPPFTAGRIDRVELRTETDEFDFALQRYALRAQPKMPHVRRAEERLQRTQRAGLATLDGEARADAYAAGLLVLFEVATRRRELLLLDTLATLRRQLVATARARLAEPGYDVERALDAEDALADVELRRRLLVSGVDQTAAGALPTERLVGVAEIGRRLGDLATAGPDAPVRGDGELALLEAEMALERAENLQIVDFLQVEYRGQQEFLREGVSVTASVRLPRRARNIRDLDELEIERLEQRRELELEARERRREFDRDVAELRRLLDHHAATAEEHVTRAERRERLAAAYARNAATRPDQLLALQRRGLRERLRLLELEEEIREDWAALLGEYLRLDAERVAAYVLR